MYKLMKKFINEYKLIRKKKSFELVEFEKYLVDKCGGQTNYSALGGYDTFYRNIRELEKEGRIKEIKSSGFNGQYPPMKTKWIIIETLNTSTWSVSDILKVSDLLDLKYYKDRPDQQTNKAWKYIICIYNFLKNVDECDMVSCEERCLELFEDEKFLQKEDSIILSHLGLTYEQLKMKKYGHMFTYWNKGVSNIKTVIILENHSTFFSFKRIIKEGGTIFGILPDALIFGEGKKIIKSMSFLDEIADIDNVEIFYFGDIDPEGYMIYRLLKEKHVGLNISLLIKAYQEILKNHAKSFECLGQSRNEENLNYMIDEFKKYHMNLEIDRLIELWEMNHRIPQEVISYEYMKKLGGDGIG